MSRVLSVRRCAIAAVLLLIPARVISAQTVVDPTGAEFDPSADHSAVLSDGQPAVERYTLALYVAGGTTPVETVDLAKPAPDPDGKIRVNFVSMLTTPPTPGVLYETRVSAEGPGGSAASAVSNTFSFQAPCTASINPASQSFSPTGGTGSVTVTVPAGCVWSAVSNVSWITLTGGASGSGNGTVAFSVGLNPGTSARSGTITIAGQTFSVTQSANTCSYTVNPTTVSALSTGLDATVSVTTGASCTWTAVSNAAWITITSATPVTGLGWVNYTVAANTTASARTGTMTVAGQTITVTQAANSCSYSVSPTTVSALSTGLNATLSVTTGASCTWTAVSNAAWITITSATPTTGLGWVNYTVAANATGSARTGTMTVAGQTVTVTQAASSCTYSVSPTTVSALSTGLNATVSVTTGASCSWTAVSNATWITITSPASMTGFGSTNYTVAANTSGSARTGTMAIAGHTVTINQAANSCAYTVTPTTVSAASAGMNGSVSVTTGASCAWTAASNVPWITITSGSSTTGLGSANYTVAANTSGLSRSGTMTIAGQSVSVTQSAAACSYSISPSTRSAPAEGGSNTISLVTTPGCTWTAVSNVSWITVGAPGSGTGSSTVTYTVAANPTASARSGTINVGGRIFTLTQAAAVPPKAPTGLRIVR
jgi:hypothetical protein